MLIVYTLPSSTPRASLLLQHVPESTACATVYSGLLLPTLSVYPVSVCVCVCVLQTQCIEPEQAALKPTQLPPPSTSPTIYAQTLIRGRDNTCNIGVEADFRLLDARV